MVAANELEFSGDLLRVYNKSQLKNRLTGQGKQHILCIHAAANLYLYSEDLNVELVFKCIWLS